LYSCFAQNGRKDILNALIWGDYCPDLSSE
jgi:hypothetical protein